MYIYYPSCNFSAASPATAKKVKAYFEKQMPVAGCCRIDKREISPADIALYICQACRETLEDKVKTQSMWEYLDALKDFNFPNLNGQKFYVAGLLARPQSPGDPRSRAQPFKENARGSDRDRA